MFYRINRSNDFTVIKLSRYLEPEATYLIYPAFDGQLICSCPSHKRPCKHLAMLHRFQEAGQIGGENLYNPVLDQFMEGPEV